MAGCETRRKVKWKGIYAQYQSIDRSWRNVFYRLDRRRLCLIYLRGFGAAPHARGELERALVPAFGFRGDQLYEQFNLCCVRGTGFMVGCILRSRLVAGKGAGYEQSTVETDVTRCCARAYGTRL
jgi:hypothetical protein